jgi:large subunit ribosomal protein L6e
MSATLEATRPAGQKKTFGKSTREVPHHTQKAKKWYPAEDEVQPKKVGSITSLSTRPPKFNSQLFKPMLFSEGANASWWC